MKKPTQKQIDKAIDMLHRAGYLTGSMFQLDDIREHAKEHEILLTDNEVHEVREVIEGNHDASIGINWDSILIAILEVSKA